ncbi:aldo-keto reductase [Endogone sp. FLAS-F59071]|nr:aldo-keto reductase [Endogone sp. FLAS-F59071]|eukprot:RUS15761.1 aldo-keto reductase [Endogone sp. FLAS-F59071]
MDELSIMSATTLSNGRQIPLLGLGVYKSPPGEATERAVLWALEVYQGYESTLQACENSLRNLGLEYIDLYITHSPNPGPKLRKESWDAMQQLVAKGKVKSIGKYFGIHNGMVVYRMVELLGSNPTIRPVINQVEIHPWLTRSDIVSFCEQQNIGIEAYSPLTKGRRLSDPTLVRIATKYTKSPAQVLIRWSLQRGFIVLPKSVTRERIEENADVFDFDLAEGDMDALNGLNENFVTGECLERKDAGIPLPLREPPIASLNWR